jgi:F-type H+-transporting ATPase subunit b
MLIDWFTVVAQLVNFFILLVALKFLLYDRVLEAMDQRRRRFVEREAETERLLSEAADETERIRADRKDLEANWEEMISEARSEAADRRRELLEEARAQVEVREAQWMASLRDSQDRLLDQLQEETGERAIEITRHAVRDLADTDLEASIVGVFLERLSELEGSEESDVMAALRSDGRDPVVVRTSFALTESQRDSVRETLHGLLADPSREVEWIRDPDMIAGIVIVVGARTIGWTIDTYLAAVRAGFAEILRHQVEESQPVTETGRVP